MTSDIVERLREEGRDAMGLACGLYCLEAADEIVRLRALSQNNAHSWDIIVSERNELRAEIERLKRRVSDLEKYPRDLT